MTIDDDDEIIINHKQKYNDYPYPHSFKNIIYILIPWVTATFSILLLMTDFPWKQRMSFL